MIQDLNKDIATIEYNHLNLPTKVIFNTSGYQNREISYLYDATGVKLEKIVNTGTFSDGSSAAGLGMITHTQYDGGFIYKYTGTSTPELTFFSHPEGYIEPDNQGNYDYVYQFKDHLGNIRLSYKNVGTPTNPVLDVIEEKNYYPFGLEHKGYNNVVNGTEHNWKFQGKEHQEELGLDWYDFHARNYDPALGRWFNMDNHAESYMSWTPYNFAYNSPLMVVDPDGQDGIFINENGEEIGNDGIDDGKVYVVKTDIQNVETGAPIDGISTEQKNSTTSFISENSGDTSAFQENSIAYDNSVEIEGSESTRQGMVDIVNQDDGTRGTGTANTTEYGGTVENDGTVVESTGGTSRELTIKTNKNTKSTFHSHRSGSVVRNGKSYRGKEGPSYGAGAKKGGDINATKPNRTDYAFDRRTGKVYIYNTNSGVQAVIPQKNFVKLPKKQ